MRLVYAFIVALLVVVVSSTEASAQFTPPSLRAPIPFSYQVNFVTTTATWVRNAAISNTFSTVPDQGDSVITVLFNSGIITASAGERFIYRVISPTGFVYDSLGSTNLTSVTDTLGTAPAILRFSAPIPSNVFAIRPEVSLAETNRLSFGRRVPNVVTISGFYYFVRK